MHMETQSSYNSRQFPCASYQSLFLPTPLLQGATTDLIAITDELV